PESRRAEVHADYGEVIRAMSDAHFAIFRSLAEDPESIDPSKRNDLEFGEERDHPLSRRQMLWLEHRFGVYFPWKIYVEMIPNRSGRHKAAPRGKASPPRPRAFSPKTTAFARSSPFEQIGRCNVMGLAATAPGPVHRDGDPDDDERPAPDHFITLCPAAD